MAIMTAVMVSTVTRAHAEDEILTRIGIDQQLDAQLPLDIPFRNDQGQIVRLGDYFGDKPVLLALVYYECPMLCGLIVNGMLDALRDVAFDPGKEFTVLVVSFDPEETHVLAHANKQVFLDRYERPGAEFGVHFLVGEEASIRALTDAVGFRYEYVDETEEYAHASGIYIATPSGRMSRYFYGIEYAPRDIRLGLVEASKHRIGSPVDRILLFCYHYDPETGKYGLLIHRVINTACITTASLLGLFLVVMYKREHRKES